jgi:hypothetical protein
MSAHIEWLSANYVEVGGTAQPGTYEGNDDANEVAAIKIVGADGDGIIIQGRPERLLTIAREVVRTAELIVEATMRDPKLRLLYGITSSTDAMRETHAAIRNAPKAISLVGAAGWESLSTPEAADMSEVFAAQEEADRG